MKNQKINSNKQNSVISEVSKELLFCEVGEKIPTTSEFSNQLSIGYGTVEKALTTLKNANAISLQARGQKGTFLLEKDFIKLWEFADLGTLIGSLPLPNTIEYQGLATGINDVFSDTNIPVSLTFKNGGKERIKSLLENRCDFVVLSSSAADYVKEHNQNIEILMKLPLGTYYSNLVIIYRKGIEAIDNSLRVGVDATSYDHVSLTDSHFPENPKKKVHYVNIPFYIANGDIDVAVWHSQSLIPLDLAQTIDIKPLEKNETEKISSAAIVTKNDRKEIIKVFSEIDMHHISEIYKEVFDRKRIPTF